MNDTDSGEMQTSTQVTTQQSNKPRGCSTYAFEFMSIFVAVALAFALNHWNDNRRNQNIEMNILKEISNGLKKDIGDIKLNVFGHKDGINACKAIRKLMTDGIINQDSVAYHLSSLTRNFISIQNTSGYESLKSKGLELIQDDSLRYAIISLYEYDFKILKNLEEDYHEMQFHANYADDLTRMLSPHFIFNAQGQFIGMDTPLKLSKTDEKLLLSHLANIQKNRAFTLFYYSDIEKKINTLENRINQKLN